MIITHSDSDIVSSERKVIVLLLVGAVVKLCPGSALVHSLLYTSGHNSRLVRRWCNNILGCCFVRHGDYN